VVAREHDCLRNPAPLQQTKDAWCIGPDRVVEEESAGKAPVDTHKDDRAFVPDRPTLEAPRRVSWGRRRPAFVAKPHRVSIHLTPNAGAGLFEHADRHGEAKAAVARAGYQGAGQHMRGQLIQRGRETEGFRLVDAWGCRNEPPDSWRAERDRARLIEEERAPAGHRLERRAAFHHDPAARRAREARDDRDRRRQEQWTWRRHHEDGQPSHRVSRNGPGETCCRKRDGHEDPRVAVGQADERRFRLLRIAHHSEDAGVRALFGGARGAHLEGRPGVGRAAAHAVAALASDESGFAGERRLIEHGRFRRDHAINGQDVAVLYQQGVPADHIGGGDRLDRTVPQAVGNPRRALEQRREFAFGPAAGVLLERLARRQHQADDRAREVLAERERADNRQQRYDVDICRPPPDRSDGGDEQRPQGGDPGEREGSAGGRVPPGKP